MAFVQLADEMTSGGIKPLSYQQGGYKELASSASLTEALGGRARDRV